MSPTLAFLCLLAITVLFCLLPFVPAITEWRRKTDAMPLQIERKHDGSVHHFGEGFRSYLRSQLPAAATLGTGNTILEGGLPDETPFLLIRGDVTALLPAWELQMRLARCLTLAYSPLVLPRHARLPMELYAADTVRGGEGGVYRAILGEKDIILAEGSKVLRWIASEGKLEVGCGSLLYGRASARQLLRLGERSRFVRLHAPRIEFGAGFETPPPLGEIAARAPLILPHVTDVAGRRWLIRGDLELPPGSWFEGDLVVTGRLCIGAGARIVGSLKSHQDLSIREGACIEGSAVSGRDLHLSAGCRVKGPVIAERQVTVDGGNQLGTAEQPTTVTAPRIHISPGVVAFGSVWAREMGVVGPGP